jgi:hypothetical protein
MSETAAVEFTEDGVPLEGIEETIAEMVDLYGGEMKSERVDARDLTLPLRRGAPVSGGVDCTVSWAPGDGGGLVTLTCTRDVDAPRSQRAALLVAGVIGAVMFMLWPFYPGEREYGALAWLGGAIAIAVYVMTLRRSSGGIAYDFLQRLAAHQRAGADEDAAPPQETR